MHFWRWKVEVGAGVWQGAGASWPLESRNPWSHGPPQYPQTIIHDHRHTFALLGKNLLDRVGTPEQDEWLGRNKEGKIHKALDRPSSRNKRKKNAVNYYGVIKFGHEPEAGEQKLANRFLKFDGSKYYWKRLLCTFQVSQPVIGFIFLVKLKQN